MTQSADAPRRRLIVGLGNPGTMYQATRHNIGFEAVHRLAEGGSDVRFVRKFDGLLAEIEIDFRRVLLLKPETFMNLSGRCVRQAIQFYKLVPAEDLLVICDDLSLPLGKLRLRPGGSDGGQKGLRDIALQLGTDQFSRLRIGIGDPVRNGRDHVLSKFAPDEVQRLDELLDAAADAVEAWAREGTSKAANRFNTFELRPADADRLAPPGEVDGPPSTDGIRRTKTGWRRMLPGKSGDGTSG